MLALESRPTYKIFATQVRKSLASVGGTRTYAKALVGVKSVLCTIPNSKQWRKHFLAFLEACNMAGVKHLIKLSIIHATVNDAFQDVPLIRGHGDCDEALIKFINPKKP